MSKDSNKGGYTPSDKAAARDATPSPTSPSSRPQGGRTANQENRFGTPQKFDNRADALKRSSGPSKDPVNKGGNQNPNQKRESPFKKSAAQKPNDPGKNKPGAGKAGKAAQAAQAVKNEGAKGAAKQAGKAAVSQGVQRGADAATGGAYTAAKKGAQAAAKVPGLRQVTKRTPGLNRLSGQKTGAPTVPGKKAAGNFKDNLTKAIPGVGGRGKQGGPKGGKKGGKPGKVDEKDSKMSGSASRNKKLIGGAVGSFLAFVVIILMAMTSLAGGVGTGGDTASTGPTEQQELEKIKDCIPPEYIPLLQEATYITGKTKEPSNIPWSMLAGILSTQTGFGKASPYDNVERYKELKMKEDCFSGPGTSTGNSGDSDLGPDGEVEAVPAGEVPKEYMGMLKRMGAVCEIPPYIYAGFIRGESNWNAQAVSGSGAQGMGQFLPGTWSSEGKDFNGDGVAEATNPYDGMWSTAHYACSILDMYKKEKEQKPDVWKDTNLIDATIQGYHDGPYSQKENGPGVSSSVEQTEAHGYLPKIRGFAEDFKKKYPELEEGDANAELPNNRYLEPRKFPNGDSGGGTGSENCAIPTDPNPIGGMSETQGVGPYLLTIGAANEARKAGYDPQSPCVSEWVASQLQDKAGEMESAGITAGYPEFFEGVVYDPDNEDSVKKTASNRVFYQAVLTHSGLFVDKKMQDSTCSVKQDGEPEDDKIAAQVAYSQIVGTFNCIITTEYLLYTVQSTSPPDPTVAGSLPSFSFTSDRREQRDRIIDEAAKFSYAAHGGWKKDMPCQGNADTPQGLIPLTKEEFLSAGYDDPTARCDQAKNVRAAALLFVSGEKVPVSKRSHDAPYTPMLGGWGNIKAALGNDRERFENSGPAYTASSAADKCFPSISSFVEEWAGNKKAAEAIVSLVESDRDNKTAVLQKGKQILADNRIKSIAQRENCAGVSDQDTGQRAGAHAQSMMSTSNAEQKKVYDAISTWATYLQSNNAAPNRGPNSSKIERLSPVVYKPVKLPSDLKLTPAVEDRLDATAGGSGSSAGYAETAVDAAVYYGWFGDHGNPDASTAGVKTGSLSNGDNDPFAGVEGADDEGGGTTSPDKCPPEGYKPPHAELSYKPQPANISIHDLCVKSVAKARNPETAKALMWAFSNVGKQAYRMDSRRNSLGVSDCSAYVSRAYAETTGLALYHGDDPKASPNPFITTDFTEEIAPSVTANEIRPGDIGVNSGHIVFYLTKDLIMDTGSDDSPPRIQPAFGSYRMARIDVKKVPKKALYKPAPFIPGVSDQWVPKDKL